MLYPYKTIVKDGMRCGFYKMTVEKFQRSLLVVDGRVVAAHLPEGETVVEVRYPEPRIGMGH